MIDPADKIDAVAPLRTRVARQDCKAYWESCRRNSTAKKSWLDRHRVVAARDAVRAGNTHPIAVALRTPSGDISNVLEVDYGGAHGLAGAPCDGSLIGALDGIRRHDDVIIATGVLNTLAAMCLYPRAMVVGCVETGNLFNIATAAARRCRLAQATMHMTVVADGTNADVATEALRESIKIGLKFQRDLFVVVHEPAESLHAALVAGWRPR